MTFVSSLVLFCICCFAVDVVELEPVQSGTYDCNELAGAACTASPYCHLNSTGCIDDPCLRTIGVDETQCDGVLSGTATIACQPETVATTGDCGGGSGKFCRSSASNAVYNYCFWANLRDGPTNCPASVCKFDKKKCLAYNDTVFGSTSPNCQFLNTEDDCKLVPKCYWRSNACVPDPCFTGSEDMDCPTWTNNGGNSLDGPLVAGNCVLYRPFKKGASGAVSSYCVFKDNKSPNLCYFLNKNVSSSTSNDYADTYPTYSSTSNPTCSGTISGCDSDTCTTKINVKGGLAGLYCGDATHGAANVLHIPSLIVFLFITIFVSMFTS